VQIHLDQPVNVEVPLELTGKAAGVVAGGTLRQVFRKLPIRCLPGQIPVKIVHDVTSLALDGHVGTKDLALPEGVSVRLPPEQTVASVVTEIIRQEEETAPAAGAAAAAPAAGAAAPAAGAAAAPAKGAPAKAPAKK
jgi:large subunit ribosomal protein L25